MPRDRTAGASAAQSGVLRSGVTLGQLIGTLPRLTLASEDVLAATNAIRASAGMQLDLTRLLGGPTDGVIDTWRSALSVGREAIAQDVATSMAGVIADSNVGFATAETLAGLIGPDVHRAMAEATESLATGIGRQIRESLARAVQPAALLASNALVGLLRASDEREREALEAVWRLGWWFPPSGPAPALWRVGRLAQQNDRVGVRHAMAELLRSPWMRRAISDWMELDVFRDRRRFILDGLRDHRLGRYRVSIPTLLPHIEGIAMDAFAPGSTATNPKSAVQTATASATVIGPAMAEAVTVLWARRTFSEVPAGTRQLNRHLILHGRSTGYGTCENSVKVVFALDLLASLVEDSERGAEAPS